MSEDKKIPQHVKLPNSLTQVKHLKPMEVLTYVGIRRYMNKKCFPSQEKLSKDLGISVQTINKNIKKLVIEGLISIRKVPGSRGSHNEYTFINPEQDGLEMISYDFLDKIDLTPQEKAAYYMQQNYMFTDNKTAEGKVLMSNRALAEDLGVSRQWLDKQNKSLENKGYIIITKEYNDASGVLEYIKRFQLSKLDQAFICVLANHEGRLRDAENRQEATESEVESLKKRIYELEQIIKENKKSYIVTMD